MTWPVPQWSYIAPVYHETLAFKYAAVRQACTELTEFIGEAEENGWLTEAELKRLDFSTVLFRLGYKKVKKVLENAGAECGRRKLRGTK